MQYFIKFKAFKVTEFLYYFTYFFLLVPKPNKTQKTHWVGLTVSTFLLLDWLLLTT